MGYTLITGATGGIGSAFAKECAKKGDELVLTSRSKAKLNFIKEELSSFNVSIECIEADLTSESDRKALVKEIEGRNLKLSRIIFASGIDTQKPFTEYTEEKLLNQLRVNSESLIHLTHSLLNYKADKLEIIVISSMSGATPMPYFALYSATKCMLINFFTSLHYELKKEGVKITTVMPGGVYTRPDIIEEIKTQGIWGKLSAKKPEYVAKKSLIKARKNKIKYIPGFFNKFLYFILSITPKRIALSFIAKRWKTHRKDAF